MDRIPSGHSQKRKFLREHSQIEKNLQVEIRNIDLEKRMYNETCDFEVKKLIKRFTNRIAKHHFYLKSPKPGFLYQRTCGSSSESLMKSNQSGIESSFKTSSKNSDFKIVNKRERSILIESSNISNKQINDKTQDVWNIQRVSSASIDGKNNNKMKQKNAPSNQEFALKSSFNNKADAGSSKLRVQFSTENFNRRPSDLQRSFSRSKTFIDARFSNQNSLIKSGQIPSARSNQEINYFIDSLRNSESGFQVYQNAKGEPVCDGYDNYGKLIKINSATSTPKFTQFAPPKQANSNTNNSISHFDRKGKREPSFVDSITTFSSSSSNSLSSLKNAKARTELPKLHNKDALINSIEDSQLIDKIHQVQKIRSLTLKNLITY